jgi:hypothetical protein
MSKEQGVIKFKVLKAKSQKSNPQPRRDELEFRNSVNTMESSFHEVDIESINDPQIQVVYQNMAAATKPGTNFEKMFNEEYFIKVAGKDQLQDRVSVQVLDKGALVGEVKVKANTLMNAGEQWYPLFNGNTPVGQLKLATQFLKGAQYFNDSKYDKKWTPYKEQLDRGSRVFEDEETPVKMDFTQALIFPASERRPDDYYDKMAVPIAKKPTVKANMPALKADMPTVDFRAPKLEGPNLAAPKTSYCGACCKPKAPKLDAPELPTVDFKGPKFEGPEVKAGCCGGKFACCGSCCGSCCKPKIKAPELDLKAPELNAPKVGCCGGCGKMACCGTCCKPRIKAPELDLRGPELKAPELNAPKVGCCGGCGKFACCGTCCKPRIKAPELDLKAPSVDIKGPKFEGPDIKAPKVGCCGGKLACCAGCAGCSTCCKPKAPELKMKAPKMNAPKLAAPSFEGPKYAAPKTPYCGTCCKPKAPEYQAVGNGFAVIPVHNAQLNNHNLTGVNHPMPGYAIVPISQKDQQRFLN